MDKKLEKKRKKKKDINASASAFGWDFQRNAAILLMLENIKTAKSIKVEGSTEDIEITLNNGNIIYSQAKSLENPDLTSNVLAKLKEGMETLNNANSKDNVESLIYITNHSNPFNDKASIQYFLGQAKLPYNDLPEKCKDKIIKIIDKNNYSIDKEKLKIYVLPFHGTDIDNRNKHIKEAVSEFLLQLDIKSQYSPKKILESWQRDFFHNATIPNPCIKVNKKDMLWILIVEICNFENNDVLLEDCDEAMLEEIEHHYRTIINNKSEEFTFINKILNDYYQYCTHLPIKEKNNKFINEEYTRYEEEFDIANIDTMTKHCLIKIILKKIINKRNTIDTIKRETCLCD